MIDETYSFTKEELEELSKDFQMHLKMHDGNNGRYKIPKHWMKMQINF
jgi:hypothetical protein